jgi:UDP-N-acetylmuramate dehydrogenase
LNHPGFHAFLAAAARCRALVVRDAPLANYTRFAIGGKAGALVETSHEEEFLALLDAARRSTVPFLVLGAGTNLIVADEGYPGVVLRFRGAEIRLQHGTLRVQAGAELQALVDTAISCGMAGIHTMTRIPGWVGAAIYGNAGAYGHSMHEFVRTVRYCDAQGVHSLDNAACAFSYRESVFKLHKDWVILEATLAFPPGEPTKLRNEANQIQQLRDAKYPPAMRCAGSIFKNLLVAQLPPEAVAAAPASVVREGKIPAAWFLEQVGAKGFRRGDIQVAAYHANLIYNDGAGTAADLLTVIGELKRRVSERFGFTLEEEVQYVGFDHSTAGLQSEG